tara:strand:+ start:777 stop:932 length:156 start_codon:yes stop_codon:yes gene_type:complete
MMMMMIMKKKEKKKKRKRKRRGKKGEERVRVSNRHNTLYYLENKKEKTIFM